jgi:hypothetical protein
VQKAESSNELQYKKIPLEAEPSEGNTKKIYTPLSSTRQVGATFFSPRNKVPYSESPFSSQIEKGRLKTETSASIMKFEDLLNHGKIIFERNKDTAQGIT